MKQRVMHMHNVQVTEAANLLVADLNKSKKFTDRANFALRCGVCNRGFKGEKEAVEHAKQTGHQSFQEY
jgi:ubiquitin thioesterase OTU1